MIRHTMTPAHLKVLLHYYTTKDPYTDHQEGAVAARVLTLLNELANMGLINRELSPDQGAELRVTAKGLAFVDALLSTPLPVPSWTTPAQPVRTYGQTTP